jgi:hypothetical protein
LFFILFQQYFTEVHKDNHSPTASHCQTWPHIEVHKDNHSPTASHCQTWPHIEVHKDNHSPTASHCQTWPHKVVSSTPSHLPESNSQR